MAQYYNPRKDSTTFSVFAKIAETERKEQEKLEKEEEAKRARNIQYGSAAWKVAEGKRAEDIAEARNLMSERSPYTKSGLKYKYAEPEKSTWKTFFKDRYFTPGDERVVRDVDLNEAGVRRRDEIIRERDTELAGIEKRRGALDEKYKFRGLSPEAEKELDVLYDKTYKSEKDRLLKDLPMSSEDIRATQAGETYRKAKIDKRTQELLKQSPSSQPSVGRTRYEDPGIQSVYDKTFERISGKKPSNVPFPDVDIKTVDEVSPFSDFIDPRREGGLPKETLEAFKKSSDYIPGDKSALTQYFNKYDEISKTASTASKAEDVLSASEDVLAAKDVADAGKGGVDPISLALSGADLYSTWSDSNLTRTQQMEKTVETGADVAAGVALASGNPYAMAAGGVYKGGKFLWDLLT